MTRRLHAHRSHDVNERLAAYVLRSGPPPLKRWCANRAAWIAAIVQSGLDSTTRWSGSGRASLDGRTSRATDEDIDVELPPEAPDLFGGRDPNQLPFPEVCAVLLDTVDAQIRHRQPPVPRNLLPFALAIDGPDAATTLGMIEHVNMTSSWARDHLYRAAMQKWPVNWSAVGQQAWNAATHGRDVTGSVAESTRAFSDLGFTAEFQKGWKDHTVNLRDRATGSERISATASTRRGAIADAYSKPSFGKALAERWLREAGYTPLMDKRTAADSSSSARARRERDEAAYRAAYAAWGREVEAVKARRYASAVEYIRLSRALATAMDRAEAAGKLRNIADLKRIVEPLGLVASVSTGSRAFGGTHTNEIAYSVRTADGPPGHPPAQRFHWRGYNQSTAARALKSVRASVNLVSEYRDHSSAEGILAYMEKERNQNMWPFLPESIPEAPHRRNSRRYR